MSTQRQPKRKPCCCITCMGPLSKCQHQQFIAGCGVSCRMCTTPVLSSSTSGSSVPPWTTTTTSAWWMWTAGRASSSAAMPQPNAWSSTGSSLRWQPRDTDPHPSENTRLTFSSLFTSSLSEGHLLSVTGKPTVEIAFNLLFDRSLPSIPATHLDTKSHWNLMTVFLHSRLCACKLCYNRTSSHLTKCPITAGELDLLHALIWDQKTSYCCLLCCQCGFNYRCSSSFSQICINSQMCFIFNTWYSE